MAWNRPQQQPIVKKSRPKIALYLCGVGLIIGVAFIVYIFGPSTNKPLPEVESSIKPRPTTKVTAATNLPRVREETITEEQRIFAETNGMSVGALRQWEFKNWKGPVYTNGQHRVLKLEEKIFENGSDRLIASLLTCEPGESMIGDSRMLFGKRFMANFKKSLTQPIVIDKDDTPEVVELKQAVIETRNELKARQDAGEDICEVLISTREAFKELSLYRSEVEKMVKAAIADGDFSEADINDCIGAANKMLEEKGAKPLSSSSLYAWMLKLEKSRSHNK